VPQRAQRPTPVFRWCRPRADTLSLRCCAAESAETHSGFPLICFSTASRDRSPTFLASLMRAEQAFSRRDQAIGLAFPAGVDARAHCLACMRHGRIQGLPQNRLCPLAAIVVSKSRSPQAGRAQQGATEASTVTVDRVTARESRPVWSRAVCTI
jgi:hypothetical protein